MIPIPICCCRENQESKNVRIRQYPHLGLKEGPYWITSGNEYEETGTPGPLNNAPFRVMQTGVHRRCAGDNWLREFLKPALGGISSYALLDPANYSPLTCLTQNCQSSFSFLLSPSSSPDPPSLLPDDSFTKPGMISLAFF